MVKVLLVDDDGLLRSLFSKRLKHAGFHVAQAVDGEEGLTMAVDFQPDLIFLDFQMPKLNGDEVLAALRQSEWGAHIPVIVMSAISSLDDMRHIDHAKKVMHKPITNREMLDAIHEVIGNAHA